MTSRSLLSIAWAACALLLLLLPGSQAHPDKIERDLLMHFATGSHKPEDGGWQDLTHTFTARLQGAPILTNIGPAQALSLNGFDQWLLVADSLESARPALPKKEISIAAWVLVNETMPDGGICNFIQDNGDYEKGFLLGFNNRSFSFIISSTGADDGDGRLTKLRGKVPLEVGRWHYVVGTYDGATMRLYVNGKLDSETAEQSGDILYPEQGTLAVGAYVDANELHVMDGAIYEVKLYSRVMPPEEIEQVAQRNRGLLDYKSSINTELQFVVQPYLQMGTQTSMAVMCETTKPSIMTVHFAERQPLDRQVSSTELKHISEVTLSDLKPSTIYFYRVSCSDAEGNIARSDIFTLQTAPGPDTPWAFGIMGDTQRNPEVTRLCAEGIFALRPNFMLHCGDVVDDGFAKHQWIDDFFTPSANLIAHVPAFPVIGNHERNSHWYYDSFSLPAPEYYYTFIYGNAQFFMIDSNKDCNPGSEQYEWLERELAKSTATWKFTCHHHPAFSSDENDYGDQWKGKTREPFAYGDDKAKPLIPLYEKYGVDIAFAGHVHSYERTWPIFQMAINQKKGVRYIVSGGAGGNLESAGPQRSWFSIHVQRGHHFCFATIHDRTIQFKAYDTEGRLFDTFELTKPNDR